MENQEFREIVNELAPSLRRLATRSRFLGFIDRDDLYQEALINIWNRQERGDFLGKTKGYIIKSCYFHMQNYIRTHKVNNKLIRLDDPINTDSEDFLCLGDIFKDDKSDFFGDLNNKLIADSIMNNGLVGREKDVVKLLYEGLNLREAAKRLGVSHVRVLKIKQSICRKYKRKIFDK